MLLQRVCPRTPRPASAQIACPKRSSRIWQHSQVSIFAAQTQTGELGSRIQMTRRGQQLWHSPRSHGRTSAARSCSKACALIFSRIDKPSQRLVERARMSQTRHLQDTSAGTDFERRAFADAEMAKDQRASSPRRNGAICRAAKFSPRQSEHQRRLSSWTAWSATISAERYGDLQDNPAHDRSERTTASVGLHSENKELRERFHALHQHRRKQQSRRRIRGRHQHRLHPRHRQYFAGRKDSGHPHRL